MYHVLPRLGPEASHLLEWIQWKYCLGAPAGKNESQCSLAPTIRPAVDTFSSMHRPCACSQNAL